MLKFLLFWLIKLTRSSNRRWQKVDVVTFDGKFLFTRYMPFWNDEWINRDGKHYNRPPWYRPFNVLLHRWCPKLNVREDYHDHPRWSVTLCLRGKLIEHTPWGDNVLTPGKMVFRTHKYIHAFSVPEGYAGKTWTIFVVGRRNHRQNGYVVAPQ